MRNERILRFVTQSSTIMRLHQRLETLKGAL
jgi:hypothetical protein